MWCLVFMLLGLYSHWWKVCWLKFGNRCKWGEVGRFMICAVLSESWSIRDRLRPHFVTNKVKLGAKSSEDWEAVFALSLEILLKSVGFILLRFAGEDQFSIEKNGVRAKNKSDVSRSRWKALKIIMRWTQTKLARLSLAPPTRFGFIS
ncbi:hypothetical protein V144x_47410 [Gimesia aquarii]|uniref:Uncharacterized protein n=1 Tax=Gimesia aquarii TaxID=2527964 RepID=A0A517W1V5_9PLAN|nr:hypothetical protein V144x_47410 [Gimesia aquarii]